MSLTVLVIDETLGENRFVVDLLEGLENVGKAIVADHPRDVTSLEGLPDILVLGSNWLDWARRFRLKFPNTSIIGRTPWQGDLDCEFFPWGDELREPSLPLTRILGDY